MGAREKGEGTKGYNMVREEGVGSGGYETGETSIYKRIGYMERYTTVREDEDE